ESASSKARFAKREKLVEAIEWNNHIGGCFFDPSVDRAFCTADPLIDSVGHALADRQELFGTHTISRYRDFDLVEHPCRVERPAESAERRVRRVLLPRPPDVVVRLIGASTGRQLDRDEQGNRRGLRGDEAVCAIDA